MIPSTLRITLLVALTCYFALILIFLKNKALELRYTLLWMLGGIIMMVMVECPQILTEVSNLLGIQSNMNGLYIICIGFSIALLMMLTSIVSKQRQKIKTLTQELAILEKRVRDLEKTKTGGKH